MSLLLIQRRCDEFALDKSLDMLDKRLSPICRRVDSDCRKMMVEMEQNKGIIARFDEVISEKASKFDI